jgi:hypothetical protein
MPRKRCGIPRRKRRHEPPRRCRRGRAEYRSAPARGPCLLDVAETEPGASDEEFLRQAGEQVSLSVTADVDFGEVVFRQPLLSPGGVVVTRLAGLSPEGRAEVASRVFRDRGTELSPAFSVSSPGRVRIRPECRAAARRVERGAAPHRRPVTVLPEAEGIRLGGSR